MPVKTYKEKTEEIKVSSVDKTEDSPDKGTSKKSSKIKLYLPQIVSKGEYTCTIIYEGKKEEVKVKDGIIEVTTKKELEKLTACGFKKLEHKHKDFGIYFCDDYMNTCFNLMMDDETTIKVDHGKAEPLSEYHVEQLLKNHFKLYKYEKDKK